LTDTINLLGRASRRAYIFRRVKHHYVPAFYLRGFVDPACPPGDTPCVWLVDLDNGKIKCKSPENAAAITDYYAVGDGENRQDVERYLSAVESQTAPVITRILGDYDTIDENDKAILAYFAALQIVRVPQFRERVEEFIARIAEVTNAMIIRSRDSFEDGLRASHPDRTFTAEEMDEVYAFACDPSSCLGELQQLRLRQAGHLQRQRHGLVNQISSCDQPAPIRFDGHVGALGVQV
jgi:hypothetical protein